MDAIIERCAGLDVHQETIVATILTGPLDKKPAQETRTFSALTPGLLELADWLDENGITHIAMESTGIYWKPVWYILSHSNNSFTLILANARNIKNVPGRKTDVKDSQWIAQLTRSGLVEGSFVPPEDFEELRELTRYRKRLLSNTTAEKNRIHKLLSKYNVKLGLYMSDLFGVTGRAIIEDLVNGEQITSEKLNQMTKGPLRNKQAQLMAAIDSQIGRHPREMLRFHWDHLRYIEQVIAQVEDHINQHLQPYREQVTLLKTLPGVNDTAAAIIIAEMGTDMSVFPSDKCCASWAGVSPGNNESAGKKKE